MTLPAVRFFWLKTVDKPENCVIIQPGKSDEETSVRPAAQASGGGWKPRGSALDAATSERAAMSRTD